MRLTRFTKHSYVFAVFCLLVFLAYLPQAYAVPPWSQADSTEQPPSEALYPIREGELWGYMDYDGNTVITPQWIEAGKFRGGKYAYVSYGNCQDGIINSKGEYVVNPVYFVNDDTGFNDQIKKDAGVYWIVDFEEDCKAFLDVESGYFSGFCLSRLTQSWFDVTERIFKVTLDGITYGYMDRTNGKLVIPCIFAYMTNGQFKNGFVCDRIYNTDAVIVMDENGDQLKLPEQVEIPFDEMGGSQEQFYDNRLIVEDRQTGLFGYCNTNGQLVILAIYESVLPFSEGFAAVEIGGKWAHIDTDGNLMCEPRFNTGYHFMNKRAVINDNTDRTGTDITVIDYQGNVIREFNNGWQDMPDYSQYGVTLYKDSNQMRIIDLNGSEVGGSFAYDAEIFSDCKYVTQFQEGIQMFSKNGKYGYVDYQGNIVSDFIWDYGETFSDGLAYVETDGKMAYINTSGQVVWSEK